MEKSKIVDIPSKMEKYYGRGKMLHPNIEIIEDAIRMIPTGKLATIDTLAKKLAGDFKTDVTCPARTGNAIKKIAENYLSDLNDSIPFWRVIRKDKFVIKSKNYALSAGKLEAEGFKLEFIETGNIKVNFQTQDLYSF